MDWQQVLILAGLVFFGTLFLLVQNGRNIGVALLGVALVLWGLWSGWLYPLLVQVFTVLVWVAVIVGAFRFMFTGRFWPR